MDREKAIKCFKAQRDCLQECDKLMGFDLALAHKRQWVDWSIAALENVPEEAREMDFVFSDVIAQETAGLEALVAWLRENRN